MNAEKEALVQKNSFFCFLMEKWLNGFHFPTVDEQWFSVKNKATEMLLLTFQLVVLRIWHITYSLMIGGLFTSSCVCFSRFVCGIHLLLTLFPFLLQHYINSHAYLSMFWHCRFKQFVLKPVDKAKEEEISLIVSKRLCWKKNYIVQPFKTDLKFSMYKKKLSLVVIHLI